VTWLAPASGLLLRAGQMKAGEDEDDEKGKKSNKKGDDKNEDGKKGTKKSERE
jgi:hypothetical protein